MILKGSQRGGAEALANHLLNVRENDHVELASLRHVAAQDLHGALREIEATANGTRATQPFFQVIINPPAKAELTADHYERALAAIEEKFSLQGQPRAVVFHEKHGRRHAHAVWSRIDTEQMKAIPLSYSKLGLRDVARALCREFGLEIPAGMQDKARADPLNYDRRAWQQAKRLDEDPRELKAIITETFHQSDSAKAFAANLEQHALMLARGDKRGFVVVHHSGEALPLHRFLGLKLGATKARLGDPAALMSVAQARDILRERMAARADKLFSDVKARHAAQRQPILAAVLDLRQAHRDERQAMQQAQAARQQVEGLQRAQRLRSGLHGFWQRLTGERGRIVQQNAAEAKAAQQRDLAERESIIARQLEQRRELQRELATIEIRHSSERAQARSELGHWLAMDRDGLREEFTATGQQAEEPPREESATPADAGDEFERQVAENIRKAKEQREAERQRGRDHPGRTRQP